jgi:hypothetical protein
MRDAAYVPTEKSVPCPVDRVSDASPAGHLLYVVDARSGDIHTLRGDLRCLVTRRSAEARCS